MKVAPWFDKLTTSLFNRPFGPPSLFRDRGLSGRFFLWVARFSDSKRKNIAPTIQRSWIHWKSHDPALAGHIRKNYT